MMLEAALEQVALGRAVFPIWSIVDGCCACCAPDSPRRTHPDPKERCDSTISGQPRPSPGKHPIGYLVPRGNHHATTDPDQITAWWSTTPDANIGIDLESSGLVVLDVDGAAGRVSLVDLDEHLTPTLTATTGSGGLHAVYSRPDGVRAGRRIKFRPGLDLLGKGYIVAAPSLHASGGVYRWDDTATAVAPLPAFLAEIAGSSRAEPSERVQREPSASGSVSLAVRAAILLKAEAIGQAVQGQGGDDLTYRVCCVAANDYGLSDDDAMDVLAPWDALNTPPWGETLIAKVRSARKSATWETGASSVALEVLASAKGVLFGKQPLAPPPDRCYGSDLRVYLGESDPGDDPDAWLIQGIVPASVPQVTVGPPKSKKTFIAEHQAICIAAGIPWLGRLTRRTRVLILAREDSVKETRRRVWRLARGLGLDPRDLYEWLRVDSTSAFYFHELEHIVAMRNTIETWHPGYVMVDSLSRTHMGDENSKKDMAIVTATWGEFCQEYDLAFGMIHHVPKSNQGTLIQRVRGTGDIGAVVRHIIGVDKVDTDVSSLEFDGNLHPLPEPFNVRVVDGVNAAGEKTIVISDAGAIAPRLDNPGKSDASQTARVKILAFLRTRSDTRDKMQEVLHLGRQVVRWAVRDLLESGTAMEQPALNGKAAVIMLAANLPGNNAPLARVQESGGNEG